MQAVGDIDDEGIQNQSNQYCKYTSNKAGTVRSGIHCRHLYCMKPMHKIQNYPNNLRA
jgi:hypothetical protein